MGWNDVITKEHMSSSAMGMFLRCPKQFEFRYVKGLKQPPNLKFSLGKAFHKGTEANYKQKLKTKRDIKLEKVKAVFADSFKRYVKEDKPQESKKEIGITQDQGVDMITEYHQVAAPKFQPLIEPEMKFTLTIPHARRPMIGYIDLFASYNHPHRRIKRLLVDTKTTKAPYSQVRTDVDIQLTIYAACIKQETGSLPDKVGFDTIIKNVKPRIELLVSTRTEAHLKRFYEQYRGVEKFIDTGAFPPTDNGQTCSWCGYKDLCHKGRRWV